MARTFSGAATDKVTASGTFSFGLLSTYSIWAYRTGAGGGSLGVLWHKLSTNTRFFSGTTQYNFVADFNTTDGEWGWVLPSDNVWHHLALTYDAGNVANLPILYIDGVAVSIDVTWAPPVGSYTVSAGTLVLGNNGNSNTRNFGGRLAEFQYFPSILSANDIRTLYTKGVYALNGRNCLAYYPVWGLHSPEPDYSPNKFTGTLTGTVNSDGPPLPLQFTRRKRSGLSAPVLFINITPTAASAVSTTTVNVLMSSMVVAPTAVSSVADRAGPLVIPEGFIPDEIFAVASTVNPTVLMSGMTVTPSPATTVATNVDPTVGVIGGTLVIPAVASVVADVVNPVAFTGQLLVTPVAASTFGSTLVQAIHQGSLSLIPISAFTVGALTVNFYLGGFVTLSWDASVGATGYKIYYDSNSGVPYSGTGATEGNSPIDVGNVTQFTLHNLVSSQNWYFAVTAYNDIGESTFSEELVVFVTTGLFVAVTVVSVGVSSNVNPTLILGSTSVTPAPAASFSSNLDPVIAISGSGESIAPESSACTVGTTGPAVRMSSMVVAPIILDSFSSSIDPTISVTGDLRVTPIPASTTGDVSSPNVYLGDIIILPDPADCVIDSLDPTINEPGIIIFVGFASCVGDRTNPSISSGFIGTPTPAESVSAVSGPGQFFSSTSVTPAPATVVVNTSGGAGGSSTAAIVQTIYMLTGRLRGVVQ